MKKSALILFLTLLPFMAKAQNTQNSEDGKKIDKEKLESKDYLPEIHGTIRGKYEYQTTMGAGRFEVRNARVSVTGNVLPIVAYKAEIDLSDEGSIKMLDAYARLLPAKGLTVTAGQMRVPFTIDAHRSPHQQYFANRSFIAKQVGNVRDVGITLGYTLPTDLPITIEGGLYNGSGLTNQKEWHKEVNYSAKTQFLFTKGLNLTLSIQSIQPEEIRVQSYDIGAYYESDRFHIEAEYLYKQYSDNAFKDVQAVNTFINYDLPLRKIFNKMSFLLRYDMMTDQSDAKTTDEETGLAKVALECRSINAQVLCLNYEEAEISLHTYQGIRIDRRALHIVNGQRGVYVKYGDLQRFRRITILYEDDTYILVPEGGKVGEDNELRLYDEVIVEGSNLQDGKLL